MEYFKFHKSEKPELCRCMTDEGEAAVYIKTEPGIKAEPEPETFGLLRQAVQRREAAKVKRKAAFKGKVWFENTVQTVDFDAANETASTPKKNEAFDGRFKCLNHLKNDYLERHTKWVERTPFKDRYHEYSDPNDGPVTLDVGERVFWYNLTRRGVDLPFDGR